MCKHTYVCCEHMISRARFQISTKQIYEVKARQSEAKQNKEMSKIKQKQKQKNKKKKRKLYKSMKIEMISLLLKIRVFLPRTKLRKPKPIMFLSTALHERLI